MSNVTIPVPGGIVGHGKTWDAVVLRPPTFAEYLDIGEVLEWVTYPNGMRIPTYNSGTIRTYFEKCLVQPAGQALLVETQGDMKLAQAIKAAIIGFFLTESPADAGSQTSEKSSSGSAATDASALPA